MGTGRRTDLCVVEEGAVEAEDMLAGVEGHGWAFACTRALSFGAHHILHLSCRPTSDSSLYF